MNPLASVSLALQRRYGRQRLRQLILGSIPFIFLLTLWQMNTTLGWLAPVFIPPLGDVLEAVVFLQEDCPSWGAAFAMHNDCLMTNHVFSSVGRMILATVVGVPAGIAIGVLAGMTREVAPQGCGVHHDEHVRRVTRREDLAARELELKAGDAGEASSWGTDLRREVRECRDVVPRNRGRPGELGPGELHSVTGVAHEADDDRFELLGERDRAVPDGIRGIGVLHALSRRTPSEQRAGRAERSAPRPGRARR